MTKGMRKKTSLVLDEAVWREIKKRAIDEGRDVQDLVGDALIAYLRTPLGEGRR